MIAENNIFKFSQPNIELPQNRMIILVKECMVETVVHFKSYMKSGFHKKKKLNENDLTQLYTKQVQILIRKKDYPFNIEGEYQDVYNLSKGFSDFFFYQNEQNVELSSIYSVESKRLPSPEKKREKEYVIGDNNNGGVERYKSKKHGKGLSECGLLGFIEAKDFKHWNTTINDWIGDLSKLPKTTWKSDEVLSEIDSNIDYCILQSIAHRISDDVMLTHLWVLIN
ncbi:hypothetical protein [Myroides marinus]|uniref:hypothetical protein n=1 Tax=Myroides marinus TaxID=703342 RepID=UPI0025772157|nr:hypothetical protein [Myroides marinus]MDM1380797.1 hypothetical protein [Myroides marinus]MDM1388069.1 hypothetical protein [Myroides marinus]MDM1395281.1 hypothetical protein [Myroides marinus]